MARIARGDFKPFLNRRASLSRHSSARSGLTYLFSKAAIRPCVKCSACLFHVLILLIQAKNDLREIKKLKEAKQSTSFNGRTNPQPVSLRLLLIFLQIRSWTVRNVVLYRCCFP